MNKFSNFAVFFVCFLSIVFHISEAVAGPEAVTGGIMEKVVSSSFAKFTGKHLCRSPLFNEKDFQAATVLKKTPEKVKDTYFVEHLQVAHSFFQGVVFRGWWFLLKGDILRRFTCFKVLAVDKVRRS